MLMAFPSSNTWNCVLPHGYLLKAIQLKRQSWARVLVLCSRACVLGHYSLLPSPSILPSPLYGREGSELWHWGT